MQINLIEGDSNLVLLTLESGSVDVICTDPPYCSGGTLLGSRRQTTGHKIQDLHSIKRYPPLLGDTKDQKTQFVWMMFCLSHCWRIAKDNGILLLFSDWRQLPLFSDVVQASGWIWRSLVVWDKTLSARPSKGRFRHQAEYVLFATKGKWKPPTGGILPGVFPCPVIGSAKNHLTGKPIGLIRQLLKIARPGGTVLDPFMGGGAILRAALLEGHPVIGIELEPESFRNAETLIRDPI
jgi:site-specific DNA-methyltransferase (adenine-specific)